MNVIRSQTYSEMGNIRYFRLDIINKYYKSLNQIYNVVYCLLISLYYIVEEYSYLKVSDIFEANHKSIFYHYTPLYSYTNNILKLELWSDP